LMETSTPSPEFPMRANLLLSLAAVLVACENEPLGGDDAVERSAEERVLDRAMAFQGDGFVEVSAEMVPSRAVAGLILEWVTADAWSAFAQVSPDVTGSGVVLPDDSLIVRAVHDEEGALSKYTVAWFPPGGGALEDIFFLVADPDWAVMTVDGVRQAGSLSTCQGCHAAREDDGWVFGVPR